MKTPAVSAFPEESEWQLEIRGTVGYSAFGEGLAVKEGSEKYKSFIGILFHHLSDINKLFRKKFWVNSLPDEL